MHIKQLGGAFAALSFIALAATSLPVWADIPRTDTSAYLGYDTFGTATMSADGRYIAGVLRDDTGDVLIVHDRTTKKTIPVQRARADQNLEIVDVEFKGERLVFTSRQKYKVVVESRSSLSKAKPEDDKDAIQFVTRVYSCKLDGSDLISLYEPQIEQGLSREFDAAIDELLPDDPDHVLMRAPSVNGTQLRKVNVRTGKSSVIESGNQSTAGWVLDGDLKPALRFDSVAGGKGTAWSRRDAKGKWIEFARYLGEDAANTAPDFAGLGRGPGPGKVIVTARRNGHDTNGLYVFNTTDGTYGETVFESEYWDVDGVLRDPRTDEVIGACYYGFKEECVPKTAEFASHWLAIVDALGNDQNVYLVSGGDLKNTFMVYADGSKQLGAYYVYDTQARTLELFQTTRPAVDPALLPTQTVYDYVAKDGTEMWGYLWLPPGATKDTRNMPMVVLPHGGPESRDRWASDPMAGYWSSQGYAVFQPHFRGGSGTGRAWVEAGHGQWGQLIQEDINDGTRALISSGIADGGRICIAGWSHGGYVAFTASYRDTELYKCSIAGAGVSDLRKMQDWVREEQGGRQSASYKYWAEAIGDPNADAAKLDKYSANRNADKVGMPLLIIHGEIDQTVPREQSEMMAKSLEKAGKTHELVILKGMDHYLRPDQGDDWKLVLTKGKEFFDRYIGPGWAPPQ